MSAMGQKQT